MNKTTEQHWNKVYSSKPTTQLGWYEANSATSLAFLDQCRLDKDEPILDVGAGATTFIDHLLAAGYRNVIALDISQVALAHLQDRLGEEKAAQVQWITDDITNPTRLLEVGQIALWHDRACLHFLTEESQRAAYVSALKKVLRPGGYAIISAFAVGGAAKCSGLDVVNYDELGLDDLLGEEFDLLTSEYYTYTMPSGDLRPYISALFRMKIAPGG
jgi:SAM-dependent methyltransferase